MAAEILKESQFETVENLNGNFILFKDNIKIGVFETKNEFEFIKISIRGAEILNRIKSNTCYLDGDNPYLHQATKLISDYKEYLK